MTRAACIKILAECRAGQLLKAAVKSRGRNSSDNGALPEGVSPMQSHRWQTMATLPVARVRELEAEKILGRAENSP